MTIITDRRSARVSDVPTTSDAQEAQQYCALAHWLQTAGDASAIAPRSIGITSCAPRAGSSTVAANLAIAAAPITDHGVLLLDLSTTRSSITNRFAIPGDLGLFHALDDVGRAGEFARATKIPNLSVLAVNTLDETQQLHIDAGRIAELLKSLEREFGMIVVDLPTTESGICFSASGLLMGVLLVMEAERTRTEAATRARLWLVQARATVLGVILNKERQHIPAWLDARL